MQKTKNLDNTGWHIYHPLWPATQAAQQVQAIRLLGPLQGRTGARLEPEWPMADSFVATATAHGHSLVSALVFVTATGERRIVRRLSPAGSEPPSAKVDVTAELVARARW